MRPLSQVRIKLVPGFEARATEEMVAQFLGWERAAEEVGVHGNGEPLGSLGDTTGYSGGGTAQKLSLESGRQGWRAHFSISSRKWYQKPQD